MKLTLLLFIFTFVLFSCKEGTRPIVNDAIEEETKEVSESEPILDTIYKTYGQFEVDSIPQRLDTTFLINGKPHTLVISLKLNGNKSVYYDDQPYEEDNKIHVTRYRGRDIIYQFELKNSKQKTLWKKRFTKKDYLDTLGRIVAQSNMYLPEFKTYLPSTKQLVLTQMFGVPASDVATQGILFFDINGKSEIHFHSLIASGGSDCDVLYAPDSSFLLTCTEIITKKGKRVNIQQKNSWLAGNMIIGNSHVFVSYYFDKDASDFGGKLYDRNGKIVKEFEFDGYDDVLGFILPRQYLKQFGRYYFVDEQNKFVLMIPEKNPTAFKKYPFRKLRYDPNNLDLDTVLVLAKEVNDHRFGIDSLGDVRSYQVGDFTGKWTFFDEQK